MSRPILTIITVNFNNNKGLIKTLESVRKQSFLEYEHIIIDANSSDGSKETINKYSIQNSHLTYWVSEPDQGIYDGMNKGIEHASGEYLYFLNSGDCLVDDILKDVPFDGTQYIYGSIIFIPSKGDAWIWDYPDVFDSYFIANTNGWISQQACFIHSSLFKNKRYDTNYKIISDWIHAVESIIINGCSYKHIPLAIAEYDGNGVSSNYDKTWNERNKWIKENINSVFLTSFQELDEYRKSGLDEIIPLLNNTKKFKKRAIAIIKFLYKLNTIFSTSNHKNDNTLGIPVIYDYQIFEMQRYGGISRYFCEIIRRINCDYKIGVKFSINYYLSKWKIKNALFPLPRFIYKNYKKFFKKINHRYSRELLKKNEHYLFHPTYYDSYYLKYIGKNPYVITVHDMIHELFPQYVSDSHVVIEQKKIVVKNASRIIAISENTKKDIVEILGIDPNKIDVIYHSTSMQAFSGKYHLKLPQKYLLFVGDRTAYKNFNRFMEAFAYLRKNDNNLYVIYTGNRLSNEEKSVLAPMGILEHLIHIKASDSELCELYSRALLFIYPSLYEGFGIPILEAYACCCPIAISNTSCFPEIAGKAAVYFDPYSVQSMIDAISETIYNQEKRNNLIELGREQLKQYSWEQAAIKTRETYRKAILNS